MNDHYLDAGFPGILVPEDLKRMSFATTDAIERLAGDQITVEKELVARVVLQFYRRGLVEPTKLADVAVMVAHSKFCRHLS